MKGGEVRSFADLVGAYTFVISSTEQFTAAAGALINLLRNIWPPEEELVISKCEKIVNGNEEKQVETTIRIPAPLAKNQEILDKILKKWSASNE